MSVELYSALSEDVLTALDALRYRLGEALQHARKTIEACDMAAGAHLSSVKVPRDLLARLLVAGDAALEPLSELAEVSIACVGVMAHDASLRQRYGVVTPSAASEPAAPPARPVAMPVSVEELAKIGTLTEALADAGLAPVIERGRAICPACRHVTLAYGDAGVSCSAGCTADAITQALPAARSLLGDGPQGRAS